MTNHVAELLAAAVRLDESPTEILNGGALAGLQALEDSAPAARALASERNVDSHALDQLWERATACLREAQRAEDVFAAAAGAATLLYSAAWVLDTTGLTSEDVHALI